MPTQTTFPDLEYTLEDKYARGTGRIYLSGVQALVRLPMMQRSRDLAGGLNTAGFVSGYRGSPLGGLDQNLWHASEYLKRHHITFVPGLNEDLAATSVWGSQQVNLWPGAKYDGVFGIWYGKGPGVDRSGDVFKHANAAGSSQYGGVLALAGDDHACRSSTLPHQSEHEFISAMMPILNPADIQDILNLGLLGWAMSRYTGRWVGFKTTAETVESSASVSVNPFAQEIIIPGDFEMPDGGLNIRWPDQPMEQEHRMHRYALFATQAFARANKIDKIVIDGPNARLGIVTAGKSYLDVLEALEYLGISAKMAGEIGIRVYKLGMTWPLEPIGMKAFAKGLEDIIVVEEKRSFIERQLKELLYNSDSQTRPSVIGKYDEQGNWVLPSIGELTPPMVARVIAERLRRFFTTEHIAQRLKFLQQKEKALASPVAEFQRAPHFCSGCPHNTSTRIPEGSRAMAGIGCHYMTVWLDRNTETFTQMGGEGTPWIGQSAFTDTEHVFVNLGDGTYFHSGSLAIRACVSAAVNITFKILYNDAVAMTGGQSVDGSLSVPEIAHQVRSEGVKKIVVVSDAPEKWSNPEIFPSGVTFFDRHKLDEVQRELRETKGLSVLIYDQTCAAEKRRRKKRGLMPDPAMRTVINAAVCEGCGDCGVASNCLAVIPLETELGRKRQIDQSTCNKDFTCVDGFCPSFVTVHGGQMKKSAASVLPPSPEQLPQPAIPDLTQPYSILVAGVGGTGVVTIGALIGMAAHLESKGITVLDQTGLAQKGGAVMSHVRIAPKPEDIHAVRIAAGEADLILGCDMVVAGGKEALAKMRHGKTLAVVNSYQAVTGAFSGDGDLVFPADQILETISRATGKQSMSIVDGTRLASALTGDSIATNLFMLGYAWQQGLVPVSFPALQQAIKLNGIAVESNSRAFAWGRQAFLDLQQVETAANNGRTQRNDPATPEQSRSYREKYLTAYQNAAYAQRYAAAVGRLGEIEQRLDPAAKQLTTVVAENYFKLLANKDEYEVARLFTDGSFRNTLDEMFEGDYSITFHLAPPLLAKRDPITGHLKKRAFGPWMMVAMKLLARMRFLRGSVWDLFRHNAERKLANKLLAEYEALMDEIADSLTLENIDVARELLALPAMIRGFGHVKAKNAERAAQQRKHLLERYRAMQLLRGAA